MSSSNSNFPYPKTPLNESHAEAPVREPVFWRVEGSLLNLTAVRPVGFFAWNAQSFAQRWVRRGSMAVLALARPFLYITNRAFATRLLHTVLRGHAWLWLDDPADAERLLPGDLAIVVGGRDHHIADEPDPDLCLTHEQFWAAGAGGDAEDPHAAVFLCGAYRLAGDVGRSLIQALPPMLVIRPPAHGQPSNRPERSPRQKFRDLWQSPLSGHRKTRWVSLAQPILPATNDADGKPPAVAL